MNWLRGAAVTFLLIAIIFQNGVAQTADTVKRLDAVVIQGYLSKQPILEVPGSVAVLGLSDLAKSSQQSLVPVLNSVPGVRMEERSPGSYRLSIRGSLLRSPFGVRNVKLYLNDLPFTDASGNAYLNLIDPATLQRIEILKGPDGSLFGANSGGVVLLDSHSSDSSQLEGSISGGSFGMFRQHVNFTHVSRKMEWNLSEAFQRADGYREQSAMKRLSLLGSGKLKYARANSVKLSFLLADLDYQTPGGLTKEQYVENPRQARPGNPNGAVARKATIYNTTFFTGMTHEGKLSEKLRHVASLFGSITDFENPAIATYEYRTEKNGGFRTFFQYDILDDHVKLNAYAGFEGQWGDQKIVNYGNVSGRRDTLQSATNVDVSQVFYFVRTTFAIGDRFLAEASLSLNNYAFDFGTTKRRLSNEWMPRLAASYSINDDFSVRASLSKGYSPPSIAEIRPNGGVINQSLQAESGWNKEAGARFAALKDRLQLDASIFRYDLTQAIVRLSSDNNIDYFHNAGGVKQTGVETMIQLWPVFNQSGFLRKLAINVSYSFSQFTFDEYVSDGSDFSGNELTGVPKHALTAGVTADFSSRVSLFVQSIIVSKLPFTDANTVYANGYELLQARINWKAFVSNTFALEFFAGGDNLLNQKYSLGNDINAFGGRYYNAAPTINFYGGLRVVL